MRKCLIILLILITMVKPVEATQFTAPSAPDEAMVLVPEQPETFSQGIQKLLQEALQYVYPAISAVSKTCLSVFAVVLLTALIQNIPGSSMKVNETVATISIALLLLQRSGALIRLGADTVTEISEYGKLLLPVMTAAMAAQGGVTTSAALYAGTVFFDTVLSGIIANVVVPLLYMYLCISVASSATGETILTKIADTIKWAAMWCLKIVLYVFTGYMGITGVISGSTDAAALKATKLAISGMVPVVGGILSDASEAVLVSTGLAKSAVGVYGVLVIIALWIRPFVEIGAQYLMLKLTTGICNLFSVKTPVKLISNFSGVMGVLLAMTGTVSLLLMISVVCLMKGVA